jgi:hypothetical protein
MFREGGIFVLPNGRELIASGDGTNFYGVSDKGEVLRYELNDAGRFMLHGRLTAWAVTDLRDSSHTVERPMVTELSSRPESANF